MNFFERQAATRRQSVRLLWLFALAVLGIVIAVDLGALLAYGASAELFSASGAAGMLVFSTLATLAVIASATLFRIASLRRGGAAVASQFGAMPVPENTTDTNLRRLRNVVEEIAIASGVAVPQIFVIEEEAAINAFAAGYSPNDAAIAVTRGALDKLNRDELQGVIAHEFSHILNGDMRLNIHLIGLLFGILVLALIGRKILVNSGGGRGKGAGGVIVVAIALMLAGFLGQFFARMIKAGVSRQREYLADASAVQFTRQTQGLAGALKKIAGLADGSKLGNADTEEVAHMLFGDGVGYSSLMATHPPLFERIKALEPSFRSDHLRDLQTRWSRTPPNGLDEDVALGLAGATPPPLPAEQLAFTVTAPAVIAQVGKPQADDYRRAGAITEAIPEVLQRASRDHEEAVPLLFGLLHAPPGKVRDRQQVELNARQDRRMAQQSLDYADRLDGLHPMLRLPLASLAFPVLRRRPRPELQQFMDTVYALVHADGQVSLFEYCLGRLLHTQVLEALDPARAWVPGRKRLADVSAAVITLLAALAKEGHDNPAAAQRAFNAGMLRIYPRLNAAYSPPTQGVAALEPVWPELDAVEPMGKELLIEGLVAAVSSDGRLAVAEAELLRAICASLHCPLPPMLDTPESRLS